MNLKNVRSSLDDGSMHRRSVADAHPRARISSSSSSIASAVLWVSVGAWLATAYGERAVRAVERELRDVWTTLTSTTLTTRANGDDASTRRQREEQTSALGREIARVNSVTTRVTMPRLLASLRRTLGRADDAVEDRLTRTCVTLAGASALELFTRTMMNLVGRRAFLDAEARRGRDTLDDASRRAFLELTSRFVETGVLELRAIVRAIVVRELRAFVGGRDGDGLGSRAKTEWTKGDAEEFMRQCRETLNKALLVPSDVFSDARALPFEKKGRLHVKAPRSFPSWESMLLPPKNPNFDDVLPPVKHTDAAAMAERARQISNLKDACNECRLVVRSPHFVVAMGDAMAAAWRCHASALPKHLFGDSHDSAVDVERAARVIEATTDRVASDANLLLASIGSEAGVIFFGDAVW
jgi:hypothetical protein